MTWMRVLFPMTSNSVALYVGIQCLKEPATVIGGATIIIVSVISSVIVGFYFGMDRDMNP